MPDMSCAGQMQPGTGVQHGVWFALPMASWWMAQSDQAALSGDSESSDSFSGPRADSGAESMRLSASSARRLRRKRAAAYALQAEGDNAGSAVWEKLPTKAAAVCSGGGLRSWCSKLSAQLKEGDEALSDALMQVRGSVRALAFNAAGCWVLQSLIEKASQQDTANLVMELHGCVRRAISSPHANYVIQKIIEVLPTKLCQFVCQELRGSGAETSRHRYGCRILCRLVEQSSQDSATVEVMDEVLVEAAELCCHDFGHYVLEAVLEHGLPEQKQRIAVALEADPVRSASDRSAVYIIEAVLQHCAPADQVRLATSLLSQPECLMRLAGDKSGCHVVKALLRIPSTSSQAARNHLQRSAGRLQMTVYGCRVLEELGIDVAKAA
jgi:hypothetical protein